MHPRLTNIIAVVAGLFTGGYLNMFIIGLNGTLISLPPGVEMKTASGLANAMQFLEPPHFAVIFMAHALGTMVASWIAVRFSASRSWHLGRIPGLFFFLGGIYMVHLLNAPLWFEAFDLVLAYLPFSWLGYKLGSREI